MKLKDRLVTMAGLPVLVALSLWCVLMLVMFLQWVSHRHDPNANFTDRMRSPKPPQNVIYKPDPLPLPAGWMPTNIPSAPWL